MNLLGFGKFAPCTSESSRVSRYTTSELVRMGFAFGPDNQMRIQPRAVNGTDRALDKQSCKQMGHRNAWCHRLVV